MLENRSLKKLSTYVLFILMLVVLSFIAGSIQLNYEVDQLNDDWTSYKSQNSEISRLNTELLSNLGYGGMIHSYKNYILRKDTESLLRVQHALGASESIVKQYLALSTKQAEKLALQDIQQILFKYSEALALIRKAIAENKSSIEIDRQVKINDAQAERGLVMLDQILIESFSYYKDKNRKPVLNNLIRAQLGYGGMIHQFKNYVLRRDEENLIKARASIKELYGLIDKYRALPVSLSEVAALEDISRAIDEYVVNLDRISEMDLQATSAEDIDEVVMVDDSFALRGLTMLEREAILQVKRDSEKFGNSLINIKRDQAISESIILTMILLLSAFLYVLFSRRIIRPVQELSEVMTQMAQGNLNVPYAYPADANTELGAMARALKVFKQSEVERRAAEEKILALAMTDPLTGLANRNQLTRKYKEMVSFAQREDKHLAMFALDLDEFKPVNDTFGHGAGDEILKNVANNLLLAFRETDIVARTGGDEFVIILFGPESMEAINMVAQRTLALLSAPIIIENELVSIGASIGIAIHEPGNIPAMDVLLKRADEALYEAKNSGRNTYHIDGVIAECEKVAFLPEKKQLSNS